MELKLYKYIALELLIYSWEEERDLCNSYIVHPITACYKLTGCYCSSCLQFMQDSRGSVVCRSCHTVTLTTNISDLPDNPYVMINNNNLHQLPDLTPLNVSTAGPSVSPPVIASQVVEVVRSALAKIPAMKLARNRKVGEVSRMKEMVETLSLKTGEILDYNLGQQVLLDKVQAELGDLKVKLENKINPRDIRSLTYVYGKALELTRCLNTEVEFCCIEELKGAAHQSKLKIEFERPAQILSSLGAAWDKMYIELLARAEDDPNVFLMKSLLVDILANKIADGNPLFRERMMAGMETREAAVVTNISNTNIAQLEADVEGPSKERDIAGEDSPSFTYNGERAASPAAVSSVIASSNTGTVGSIILQPAKPSFSEMAKKPKPATAARTAAAEPTPPRPRKISKKSSRPHCFLQLQEGEKPPFRVVLELRPDKAPKMVENFLRLCQGLPDGRGYRGSRLFRAKKDDYVAGGDYQNNDGTGSHSSYDEKYFLADRCTLGNHKGAIRMKGVQRTSDGRCKIGSQFMIWVADVEDKDFKYSLVFGAVVDGLQELVEISRIGSRQRGPVSWLMNSHVTIIDCGVL